MGLEKFLRWWCRHFHGTPYWPVKGVYRCRVCRRVYRVWSPVDPSREPRPFLETDVYEDRTPVLPNPELLDSLPK